MKSLKRILVVVMAVLAMASSASAQFRWGVKVGADINKLKFNENVLSSSNRAGFTGGIITEFTVPIIGIGFDASVMYTHKNNKTEGSFYNYDPATICTFSSENPTSRLGSFNTDFIEIPINLKYKFGIPVIGKIITPYIITGPNFGFLVSKKTINNIFQQKSCHISWNVGAGVQLFGHLQVSAQYGFGIKDSFEYTNGQVFIGEEHPDEFTRKTIWKDLKAKSNTWTITAAYLF